LRACQIRSAKTDPLRHPPKTCRRTSNVAARVVLARARSAAAK
jgi:hypothetical protein